MPAKYKLKLKIFRCVWKTGSLKKKEDDSDHGGAEVSNVKYRCKLVTLPNEGMFLLEVNVEMLSSYEKGPACRLIHNNTTAIRFTGETQSWVFLFCYLFVHYQNPRVSFWLWILKSGSHMAAVMIEYDFKSLIENISHSVATRSSTANIWN